MPSPTRSVAFFGSLFSLGLVLAACGGGASDAPAIEPPLRPVRLVEVFAGASATSHIFSGSAQAPGESALSFRVPGRLDSRMVEIGERVSRGQLLARLDPTDYRLRVDEAQAGLAEARARARSAAADYERVQALYANGNVARRELDLALASHEASRAAVDAAQRRLALARAQLSYTRLVAPAAGTVTDTVAEPGETLSPGQPVARVATGEGLEVALTVPEGIISRIALGAPAEVAFAALDGAVLAATVTEVGAAPRNGLPAYPVVVRLEAPDRRLRKGMAAEVRLALGNRTGADSLDEAAPPILVPSEAVAADDRGQFVWRIESLELASDGRPLGIARRIAVEPGTLRPEGLEILSGLAPGDRIVSAGVGQIRDEQQVLVLDHDPLAETTGFGTERPTGRASDQEQTAGF